MSKAKPKLSESASPQARRVHAFLIEHDLSGRGWAKMAGVSSSLLSELFSGKTRSLTHEKLQALAGSVGVTVQDITGSSPPINDAPVSRAEVYRAVFAWATSENLPDPASAAEAVISFLDDTGECRSKTAAALPAHSQ